MIRVNILIIYYMESIVSKLKNKPIPKKKGMVEVVINKNPFIIDKTKTGFDALSFISKIKKNNIKKIEGDESERDKNEKGKSEDIYEFVEPDQPKVETIVEKSKPKKIKRKLKIIEDDEPDKDDEPSKDDKIPETEIITIKPKPKSKPKVLQPLMTQIEDIDEDRFKKVKNVDIRVSSYYMSNRESFINFINKIFHPYREILEREENSITCENLGKNENRDLMIHQRIVRDYVNLYTPYRGLLLYHGLGSGKTCSSIGIVEGMKNEKRVIIMTPASLRANYMTQLKECGDYMYKLNQFWEWFPIGSGNEKDLSRALSLSVEEIRRRGGAWLINVKKAPNYNSLSSKQKEEINAQIDKMIENKYTFINYNGLRLEKLREMTNNFRINLFDNCVIVIDEAHNFISRIVNKLNKTKDTNLKDPTSLSLILYKFLLSCDNSRIVLLTGTPMVNYPNEIGILFNILRGYIKTWKFSLETTGKLDREMLQEMLEINKQMDYFEYSPSTKTLTVTRNPFGFENVFKGDRYEGVREIDERGVMSNERFVDRIVQILKQNNITVKGSAKLEVFKCLPDTINEFSTMFIDNNNMKNENLFKRRIIGLTSYFKSAQEELMPQYDIRKDFHVIDIPMSDYQFEIYEKARIQERKLEKNARKNSKKDELKESSSTYRIFSRLFCNYVMPQKIGRPLPNDTGEKIDAADFEDPEITKDDNIEFGETNLEANVFDGGAAERKLKKEEEKAKKESEKARKEEEKARKEAEKAKEKAKKEAKKAEEKAKKEAKKAKTKKEKPLSSKTLKKTDSDTESDTEKGETMLLKTIRSMDGESIDEDLENYGDATYDIRIREAMNKLIEDGREYLSEEALEKYSPKYLEILKNIKNPENEGLNLVYSQFRTLEGIGIFAEVLKFNGFVEFKVIKTAGGWDIDMDVGKPAFALYTGTEGDEEKELIRKIYNGQWNDSGFPVNISKKLNKVARNNNMGKIIKVFMITASGSEGINLRNTRYVHIMEPYWNPARIEQVIGRARRICSHQELPKELQTVEVFVYLMIFTETQIKASKELRKMDLSKRGNPRQPVSSDYALYEINLIKSELSAQFIKAIKESSIDCAIHPNNKDLVCMNFGTDPSNDFITTPSIHNEQSDKITKLNVKKKTWKARKIRINGIEYAYNEDTGVIYDYDMYRRDELKRLGERIKNGSRYEIHWD